MNQRIHIHHDENDTPRRMIDDFEREQQELAREFFGPCRGGQGRTDDEVEQSGLVVGVVIIGLLGFAAGLALGWLIGGIQ